MKMYRQGIGLLEILIVVAIVGIVAVLSMVSLKSFLNAEALDKDTEAVISILREARSNTLSSQGGMQYGVHFTTTSSTLFSGSTYSASASDNRTAYFSGRTSITTSIAGGGDVVFQKLTGQTSNPGTVTITLKADAGKTRVVRVYGTGLIERN